MITFESIISFIALDNDVTKMGAWTSGTYVAQVDQYLWWSLCQGQADPIPFPFFTNWMQGEPNNEASSSLNCVNILPSQASVWTDQDCSKTLPFICEF